MKRKPKLETVNQNLFIEIRYSVERKKLYEKKLMAWIELPSQLDIWIP